MSLVSGGLNDSGVPYAMDQLTSSQQAFPNCLPSQGLYALL